MIRFYSLFVTDDDLLASHYVRRFNLFHDLTVHRGKTETVTFLMQTGLTEKQYENLNVIFDPAALHLEKIDIKSYKHQTLLTVTLTPKEIGSVRIGFAFPQAQKLHRERLHSIPSPLTTMPCKGFAEHVELTNA